MKCKGCEGEIKHVPLALVKTENKESYHWAGPALTHSPAEFCQWFQNTPAAQIIAYINVAGYKTRNAGTIQSA